MYLLYNTFSSMRKEAEYKPIKIAHIASELYPYSQSGGLAPVVHGIATNTAQLGAEVCIFTPMYGGMASEVKKLELLYQDHIIKLDSQNSLSCSYYMTEMQAGTSTVKVFFVSHYDFFGRYRRNIYRHHDTPKRFYFFAIAVLELMYLLRYSPDVIHLHDWMTALVPEIVRDQRKYYFPDRKHGPSTLLTIHNLAFQGSNYINIHRFDKVATPRIPIPRFNNDKSWEKVNFMKRGLVSADNISTVSPQYASEIVTPKFGEGLTQLLRARRPIIGITNGIDHKLFDPVTNKYIYQNFNSLNFTSGKLKNKQQLFSALKLPKKNLNKPVFIMVHRLAYQKGYDLIIEGIEELMKKDMTLIIMGEGDKSYTKIMRQFARTYTEKFRFRNLMSTKLEHRLGAAADFMLLPSVYEPCGTAHMKAMRYGVVPIAHGVGGLVDTISDFDPDSATGTGFLFNKWDTPTLLQTIDKAIEVYKDKELFSKLVRKNMTRSNTWEQPALEYMHIYHKIIRDKLIRPKRKVTK